MTREKPIPCPACGRMTQPKFLDTGTGKYANTRVCMKCETKNYATQLKSLTWSELTCPACELPTTEFVVGTGELKGKRVCLKCAASAKALPIEVEEPRTFSKDYDDRIIEHNIRVDYPKSTR